jgi:hypothetical protein
MGTNTVPLMDREHAAALIAAYDTDVRLLSRKPKYELVAIETMELRAAGMERCFGGPVSKDEFLNSILDLRFPRERMDEARHVAGHEPGEVWSACQFCVCQAQWVSGGFLIQCDGRPGHDGIHRNGQSFYAAADGPRDVAGGSYSLSGVE